MSQYEGPDRRRRRRLDWDVRGWVRVPTLSDATNRFEVHVGFSDDNVGAVSDGIYFRYRDNVNAGNWTSVTSNSATQTSNDSSTAVAANTWYLLEISCNAAGTSVDFIIDGSTVATHTTNIPSSSIQHRLSIEKTVGTTSRDVDLDAFYCYGTFTTDR